MGTFNEELVKAGVMLAGEGLHPSSKGSRVKFAGKNRTVMDGPFAETKELAAGFWIWKCDSLRQAIWWAKRCPNPHNEGGELEIRQIFEVEDFGENTRIARTGRPAAGGGGSTQRKHMPAHGGFKAIVAA